MVIIQKTVRFTAAFLLALSFGAQAGLIPLDTAIKKFTSPHQNHMILAEINDALIQHAATHEELLIDEDQAKEIVATIFNNHISDASESDEEKWYSVESEFKSNSTHENQYAKHVDALLSGPQKEIDPVTLKSITLSAYKQTDETSCGYHAAFNAKAIQTIFTTQQAFTAENIQRHARSYHNLMKINGQLELGQIIEITHKLDVKNIYFLQLVNGKVTPAGGNSNHSFAELIFALKYENEALCAHFICHTGDHWILLSVAKDENRKPKLFFQDSAGECDVPPTDSRQYKFIQTIYNLVCDENIA